MRPSLAGLAVCLFASASCPAPAARFHPCLDPQLLNATGIAGGPKTADLDGTGHAFPESLTTLPTTVTVKGVPFTVGRTDQGNDHWIPDGQTARLPRGSRRLYLLGARTMSSEPSFVEALREDSTVTTLPLLVTDWCQLSSWGEIEALAAEYRITPAGTQSIRCRLWATSLALPPRTAAVRIPTDRDLHIFAMTADTGSRALWQTRPLPPGYLDDRCPRMAKPLPQPARVLGNLHLGFVVHAWAEGFERYAASGSHSMLLNLFGWAMRSRARQMVDYTMAEQWLRRLYKTGLQAAVIIDTSIHHSNVPWRAERTRKLGENVVAADGSVTSFASHYSPEYRRMVGQYIDDLTQWVATNDPAHRFRAYVDGAEVFWPGVLDYSPMAQNAFREWLLSRHGSLEAINARCGADFVTSSAIVAPAVWRVGDTEVAPSSFVHGPPPIASWLAPLPTLGPSDRILVSCEIMAADLPGELASVQLVFRRGDRLLAITSAFATGNTWGKWKTMEGTITVPSLADNASIALATQGPGLVQWRRPTVSQVCVDENLVPNPGFDRAPGETTIPLRWSFSPIHGSPEGATTTTADGSTALVTHCPTAGPTIQRPAAMWDDFVTFSMEGYAQTMNGWARRIRRRDPKRDVMHYLGFTLGFLGQWDDITLTMRPDIFLANAPDVDINGIQICASNGDFHYATSVIDLARKHGKPVVATDLQDFTHGVYVGFNSLNRTSLACVAHGLSGAYWYCWRGTDDYEWDGVWSPVDTRRMVNNVEKAVRFLQGATLSTSVALLHPVMAYSSADPNGCKSDMLDAMGWYKLITQSGLCPQIYTPYELSRGMDKGLADCRLLFVPDCPVLPATVAERVRRHAEDGGTVVLSGRPPQFDDTGRPLERPLIPSGNWVMTSESVRSVRVVPSSRMAGDAICAAMPAGLRLSGAGTLRDAQGVWPGILRQPVGRGFAVWTGGLDGRGYLGPVRRYAVAGNTPPLWHPDGEWKWPREEGRYLLQMVDAIASQSEAKTEPCLDPPNPLVEMCVYKRGGETLVMLIHTGPGLCRGAKLRWRSAGADAPEVMSDFESRPAVVERSLPGTAVLSLPPFADSCTVRW